jgi:hypothetical protein
MFVLGRGWLSERVSMRDSEMLLALLKMDAVKMDAVKMLETCQHLLGCDTKLLSSSHR